MSVSAACRRRAGRVNNHSPTITRLRTDLRTDLRSPPEPAATFGDPALDRFGQLPLRSAWLPPTPAAHAAGSTVSAPRASRPRLRSGKAGGAAVTSVRHPRSAAATATTTPPPVLVLAPAASAPESRAAAIRPRQLPEEGEGPSTSARLFSRSEGSGGLRKRVSKLALGLRVSQIQHSGRQRHRKPPEDRFSRRWREGRPPNSGVEALRGVPMRASRRH